MLLTLSRLAADEAQRTSSVRMLKLAWRLRGAAAWLRGADYSDRGAVSPQSPRDVADGRVLPRVRPSASLIALIVVWSVFAFVILILANVVDG